MQLRTILAAAWLVSTPLTAQFQVAQIVPPPHSRGASPLTDIVVTFTAPLDPGTVTADTVRVFGRWSGALVGLLSLVPGNSGVVFRPASPLAPGEQVSVMLTPGLMSFQGAPLPATWHHHFWTAAGPAPWSFSLVATYDVRQPGEGNVIAYGAYAGDLDGDGFPDLSIPTEVGGDVRRFMNDGQGGFGGGFTVHAVGSGTAPSANEGEDFNEDGWTDLCTANIAGGSVGVLLGDGAGGYLPATTYSVGSIPRGLAVLDANGDGHTDIVTANRGTSDLALLRGNGDGTFQTARFFDGGVVGETSLAGGDANGDGHADLFVGGFQSQNVALLLGDGAGGFSVAAVQGLPGAPWMLTSGDVNGDGNLDVAAATANAGQAVVVRGDGTGALLPGVGHAAGSFSIAIDLGDLDGDGDLDMIASNFSSSDFALFRNDGAGGFGAATHLPALGAGSCAVIVDLDGDEDMEVVGLDESADKVYVWQTAPNPVQLATHGASLELDGSAQPVGFLGLPPVVLPGSTWHVLTVRGERNQPFFLATGPRLEPGLPVSVGVLNLLMGPYPSFVILVDGFNQCQCRTGLGGVIMSAVYVPSVLLPGLEVTLQGLVGNPANLVQGATLTNPLRVVFN